MPDPFGLLSVARLLLSAGTTPPSDAQLRRAVSTAYYAVFHNILRGAAERFVGPNQDVSAGYRMLYQSFDHRHMKAVCDALDVATLKDTLKRQLGRESVSQNMRISRTPFRCSRKPATWRTTIPRHSSCRLMWPR
ncbi:MAG: hypothetical protein WCC64_02080 [Aliidongia sp.]